MSELRIIGVAGMGEVVAGDDVGAMIADAAAEKTPLAGGDIVVVAQKIVSKAEGRLVPADDREQARDAARREARRILRDTPSYLIVRTRALGIGQGYAQDAARGRSDVLRPLMPGHLTQS